MATGEPFCRKFDRKMYRSKKLPRLIYLSGSFSFGTMKTCPTLRTVTKKEISSHGIKPTEAAVECSVMPSLLIVRPSFFVKRMYIYSTKNVPNTTSPIVPQKIRMASENKGLSGSGAIVMSHIDVNTKHKHRNILRANLALLTGMYVVVIFSGLDNCKDNKSVTH